MLFLAVFVAAVLTLAVSFTSIRVKAYERPTEFGEEVSRITYQNETYVNYERGYEKHDVRGAATAARAGYRMSAAGESKIELTALLEVVAKNFDTSVANIYGASFDSDAEKAIVEEIIRVYTECYNNDFVLGVPYTNIGSWGSNSDDGKDLIIKQDFRYGDSTATLASEDGGLKNIATICYSMTKKSAFVVKDSIREIYENNKRILGAPVTNFGEYTISGMSGRQVEIQKAKYSAQIFETGVLVSDRNFLDGAPTVLEGAVVNTKEGEYELVYLIKDQDLMTARYIPPQGEETEGVIRYSVVPNIDGIWHPLKNCMAVKDSDAGTMTLYANYRGGAVEAVYSMQDGAYGIVSSMRYAGKNFTKVDRAYVLENTTLDCINSDEYLFEKGEGMPEVTAEALAYYRVKNPNASENDIKAAFKACYEDLYKRDFIAGYRASNIKTWDLVVLDFKFGDGTIGFDGVGSGNRERMTTLVYSQLANAVYPVYDDYFRIFKADTGMGRKVLGAPISYPEKNKTVDGVKYEEIQFFENGYVYLSLGKYIPIVGYRYNKDQNVLTAVPAPEIASSYGALVSETTLEDIGETYMNYQNGCVLAKLNVYGNGYTYEYHPGRYFDEDMTAQLLSMDKFVTMDGLKSSVLPSEYDFENNIKAKIYNKYREMYAKGIFLGFIEGTFSGGWNNVYAQQFIFGDSTANPFGSSRPGVSAIIYNKSMDKVFVLMNYQMSKWAEGGENALYNVLGVPKSDAYKVPGYSYEFQDFTGTIPGKDALIVHNGSTNCAYFTEGMTASEFIKVSENYNFPSHNNNIEDDYFGYSDDVYMIRTHNTVKTVILIVGLVLAGIAVGVGVVLIIKFGVKSKK